SFAPLENHYGHASSLAMEEKLVFLQLDQATRDDGKSRVVAIDALTGTTVWEARREVDASWASPIVAPAPSGPQLILSATPWAIAYEPASGAEIWRAKCLEGEVAPSPIYSAGKVYVVHSDAVLSAIKPDGKGDVTETHIAWTAEDNLPNTASPVSSGELLFLLETQGWVTCYDASDGSKQWEHEIESNFYSSPSLAGDRLLVIDQKGVSYLLHAGRELKELGSSKLGEGVISSPAFSAGRIFIRGQKHLFAIGNTEAGERQER
ncbi:MAG: PQQ-binding-like beta-propeller repeat protein, partial [Planctomycetes bacterium]|nr:PQQ-binding-like beta-propeller repeat protein [Planctomycetota bacterium]